MSPEIEALGRRAAAAPGWRWLPGMRATRGPSDGWRLRGVGGGLAWDPEPEGWGYRAPEWPAGAVPDLSDAATTGCLLALVRERHHAEIEAIVARARDYMPRRVYVVGSPFPEPMPEAPRPVGDALERALTHFGLTAPVAERVAVAALVAALEAP